MRESVAACIDSEGSAALYLFLLLEFENSDLLKIRNYALFETRGDVFDMHTL